MAIIRLKEIFYDNKPVLTEVTRKAVQAKADAEGNIFSETYLKKDDIVEIELTSTTGELSQQTFNLLIKNNLNKLVLKNNGTDTIYSLGYRDSTTRRYTTDILTTDYAVQVIDVNITTRRYTYHAIGNQILADHITNTDIHTTAAEKAYWNDKITCTFDDLAEKLTFTKNNLLNT